MKSRIPQQLIAGVEIRQLKRILDERGFLMEMMRPDWPEFKKFGQSYITCVHPDYVKGWHYHKVQTDHFVTIRGVSRIVCVDTREASATKGLVNEFVINENDPYMVIIPPFVIHGFASHSDTEQAWIVNYPTEMYNYKTPDEYRIKHNDPSIPYDWGIEKGG